MIVDCVITSCNTNPLYIEFIPYFIKAWTKLYPTIDIKIILINDVIPEEYEEYKNYIILFNPPENINTSFISQYIRLLYPCILNYKNGILITDIDMIPLNSTYYIKNIENIEDDKFIYLRNEFWNNEETAMCYNIGLNNIWREIFDIHSIDDIYKRLTDIYPNDNNIAWNRDQLDLYKYVMEWNKEKGGDGFVFFNDNDTGFNRLNRNTFVLDEDLINNIRSQKYIDYHCLRPYKENKIINDLILSSVSLYE